MIYDKLDDKYIELANEFTGNEIYYDIRYLIWYHYRGYKVKYFYNESGFFPFYEKTYRGKSGLFSCGYNTFIGDDKDFKELIDQTNPLFVFIRHHPLIQVSPFLSPILASDDIILKEVNPNENIRRNIEKGKDTYTLSEIKDRGLLQDIAHLINQLYSPSVPYERDTFVLLKEIWQDDTIILGAYNDNILYEISIFIRNNSSGAYITNLPIRKHKIRASAYLLNEGIKWVKEKGDYIHLGGGRGGERDSLFDWKKSWGGWIKEVYHSRIILDKELFNEIEKECEKQGKTINYFPRFYECGE